MSYSFSTYNSKSNYFVFSAQVYIDCPTLQCTADRDTATSAKSHTTGVLYEELFVRHWDTWETPGKTSHLFVQFFSVDRTGMITLVGQPVDLMAGQSAMSPVAPDGGAEQYAIAPNGLQVAFTAALVNHASAWTTGWITYVVSVNPQAGSVGVPVSISGFTQARTENPVYSPDGTRIAFLAMDRPGFEADRLHIVVYDIARNSISTVANNWDRSVGGLIWTADGSGFLVDADEDGRHKVFQIDGISGSVSTLVATGDNMNLVVIPGRPNSVLLLRNSYTSPTDLWVLTTAPTVALQQITNLNRNLMQQISMSVPTSIYFQSVGNVTVQAWLLPPFGYSPSMSRSWPLAHIVHGGPQGAWTDAWSYRWNPQLWASRGYWVLMPNPRGSSGFGQAFEDAVSGDWGGAPFKDVMASLNFLLTKMPMIDSNRVCACGASYGGFMMNWLNGHTVNYKCLVNHDGVFDSTAMYYSTEEIWFMEWEYKGSPTTNPQQYTKFSPSTYVANWQTPTLVVHGGLDFRIPITQGISTFTALQRKGVDSKLLYFPDENHWVLKPQNGIKWYDTVLSWLDHYTNNTPPRKYE